ncbi:MAG: TRAP transporter large permease subunit, partial [Acidobacteria bacterium]|nr:TRAP transporter large permease subunit [Acidobacteriota bacterium]
LGLGYKAVSKVNPKIIYVSITPFGKDGPYAKFKASDLTLSAMGGLLYLTGDTDRPPVRISIPQSRLVGAVHAAMGALAALYFRNACGEGQLVDVSIRDAVTRISYAEPLFWQFERFLCRRQGTKTRRGGLEITEVWPCQDGQVCFRMMSGAYAGSMQALVGWMPGSLAIVTTLLLAFFTPLTGASGVTILSLGGLLLPLMTKAGYPEKTSIGLVTVAGSIGLLFPPSTPVILFGIYAQTPIDDLFIGGLVPGILLMSVVGLWGARRGWLAGASIQPFSIAETRAAVWDAKWDLLLPVIIAGGIFGGFTTAVEAAAVTVLYAFIVECVIHRDLGVRKDLPRIAVECSTLVGGFLIILAVALGFTSYLEYADVPTQALAWVRAHVHS